MVRGIAIALLVLAAALAAALYVWNDRPDLERYSPWVAERWRGAPGVTVSFLGVSTLLISDGETHLMTDGFFSRPSLWDVAVGELAPDPERIGDGLARAGAHRLDAVIVLHSHYDHAMDAPDVAERTGAVLVGSESTANIARGRGLPNAQIVVPEAGLPLSFGRFTLTMIESRHLPHGIAEGTIAEPLVPPARALDYKQGKTYIAHLSHPSGDIAVVGSAGFVEGALTPYRSEIVLLGVGGLGNMTEQYRETFYREVVDRLQPTRVIPIHYDDFTRPLSQPLALFPRIVDDFDQTMEELQRRASTIGFELQLLPLADAVLLLDS